jgi:tetratricopeptide (TPR) repeat protein
MLTQFRRKGNVDALIRELSNKELIRGLNKKQLSPDDLKQLGDLYLQKGETRKAIGYFYRAADEFSVHHQSKALAVYKKILSISPSEIAACEKIISVLSGDGLVAEQIKYLMIMAEYHESRKEIHQAASVFRRILDLDPDHPSAKVFFNRGKAEI